MSQKKFIMSLNDGQRKKDSGQRYISILTIDSMEKCIFCGIDLYTPCELLYGVCKEHAPKVKQILRFAVGFGMSMYPSTQNEMITRSDDE